MNVVEYLVRLPQHALVVQKDLPRPAGHFTPKKHVHHHIAVFNKGQVLVDGGDAKSERAGGSPNAGLLAAHAKSPAVRLQGSANQFDQSGFAGAVVANQSVYAPSIYFPTDRSNGMHCAERFVQIDRLQNYFVARHTLLRIRCRQPGFRSCAPAAH